MVAKWESNHQIKVHGEIYSLQEERGHTINIPLLIAMIMLKPDKEEHCYTCMLFQLDPNQEKKQKPLYQKSLFNVGYIYIYI